MQVSKRNHRIRKVNVPRKKVLPGCVTGKDAYPDEIAAKLAAARMNTPRRPYHCNLCPSWHHSTQAKRHSA